MSLAHTGGSQSGMTLIELMIALVVLSLVMTGLLGSMQREASVLADMTNTTARERTAAEMLGRLESLLEYAAGATPRAFLVSDMAAGETLEITVDSNQGFPPFGFLLLEPGTAWEERVQYADLDPVTNKFTDLTPGARCTGESGHNTGLPVLWAGLGLALDDQVAPPADQWDGRLDTDTGPVFFRGDATAFSFRIPTDPGGKGEYFDDDGIKWGAAVGGADTLEGWAALRYDAVLELREDVEGRDLNRDGDVVDVFDLGRIELVTWNAFAAGPPTRVRLCPPIVMQERCNEGGDLDGDGFDDPIFVWFPMEGRLEVRLFLALGHVNGRQVIRRTSSTIHLRNGALE